MKRVIDFNYINRNLTRNQVTELKSYYLTYHKKQWMYKAAYKRLKAWQLAAVRVKDGMSLRNGMWHGVRNGIIMRNTIYAGNKLTEERVIFSRQFYKSSSFLMLRTLAEYIQQFED